MRIPLVCRIQRLKTEGCSCSGLDVISVRSLSFRMLIQSKEKCRCRCGSVIHFQSLFPEKVSIVFTKSSSSALLFNLLIRVRACCSYLDCARASVGVSYFSLASLQYLYIDLETSFNVYIVKI